MTTRPQSDAVHEMFGLSYANYLVLHRTLLQSMPDEWQQQFAALVDEYDQAWGHVERPEAFEVETGRFDHHADMDGEDRPVFKASADPVPHYNRGRTYIEPCVGGESS